MTSLGVDAAVEGGGNTGAARTSDVFQHLTQVGDQSLTEMRPAEVGRDADGM
jgi:hypothetical protein